MKSYVIAITMALSLAACGDTETIEGLNGAAGKDGSNGINGVKGDKGDQGDAGSNGSNGTNGSNGHNSLISALRSNSISSLICQSGSGVVVKVGLDDNDNNVLDLLEQDSIAFVCDGLVGPAGPASPMSIVAVIDPCGDAPGIYDEVLLRLQNGTIIGSFSDNASGLNTRFSLLTPGNYITTDASMCHFNVSPTLVVTW